MNMAEAQTERERMISEQDEKITRSLANIKQTFIVMSGKGGVGKSTVAINLAVGISQKGYRVGLMDVDLHGPSTLKMLGLEGRPLGVSGQQLIPIPFSDNLKVVSMAALLDNKDTAVIWRGPLKIGAIKQFISDVLWEELDFLIIDSPPGTGDEPLTIAQVIPAAQAIIVTTPQEVSLLDIRKSITFCRKVNMPVFGIIENMSGLICPHCGKAIELFSTDGGKTAALDMNVPFLGKIPIKPEIVDSGDKGEPFVLAHSDEKHFQPIIDKITEGENQS
jgi:Mrp family chromosome partitioning ATPase